MTYDLLALWAWEYDADFIDLLRKACEARGVSACFIGPDVTNIKAKLIDDDIRARVGLDRVWDWGGDYEAHVETLRERVPLMLNDFDQVRRAWSKVGMHMTLIDHGLHAPYLLVLPSLAEAADVQPLDLSPLGGKFSIKGAHSGGSGVIDASDAWEAVLAKRREWPNDQTIVQAWVEPKPLGKRPAWFRVFYACGATYPCWANDRMHIQHPVTPEEENRFQLGILRGITQQIAGLCGLNAFSTEIALDQNNIWQVCDYVNEPCDYRLKSTIANGVPDEVVVAICDRIAGWVKRMTSE